MTGAAELVAADIASLHPILVLFQGLVAFGGYLCPISSTPDSIASYDYVIAGGGTAGSLLAYRLSECCNISILLLEEGECPPIESIAPGLFPLTPRSYIDRAMNLHNDSYTCQNQQPDGGVTAAKALGGTGCIDHMIRVWPTAEDLDRWCAAANDSSYCGESMFKYFQKSENVTDPGILAQNSTQHGTNGELKCTRQQSTANDFMKKAFIEMGYPFLNDTKGQCANEPMLTIGDNLRQNGNVGYLSKMIYRPNFTVLTGARVEKIIFNGTTATGLQYNYNGTTNNVTATKKVVIALGTMKSPQLLMLSGVGNATELEEKNIKTLVNNPHVGKNLQDHAASALCVALDNDTSTIAPADPYQWPGDMTLWFLAANSSQMNPDMTVINVLASHDSTGLIQLCMNVFKYTAEVCNEWAKNNVGRNFLAMIMNYLHPVSAGRVTLNTTDMKDQPIIESGMFSNGTDLENFAVLAQKVGGILNTTVFKNLGADFVDFGFCSNYTKFSYEFWKCHVLALSSPGWHFIGTCSLGKVVNANMHVIGTQNLMIVDGSIIPSLPSAKISASVTAFAEKAADIIKNEHSLSCSA